MATQPVDTQGRRDRPLARHSSQLEPMLEAGSGRAIAHLAPVDIASERPDQNLPWSTDDQFAVARLRLVL